MADELYGNYLTPEYDMGSIKKFRVFGDFRTAFISPAGSFQSIWPSSYTFYDANPTSTKSFSQLYNIQEAARLDATLYYGITSGSLTNSLKKFEITSPEISARYFQVKIEITDPAVDSNLYLYTLNLKTYTGMTS